MIFGGLTAVTGTTEIIEDWRQNREYKREVKSYEKIITDLKKNNDELKKEKQKTITQVRYVDRVVEKDLKVLEDIVKEPIKDKNSPILIGLKDSISSHVKDLKTCKTALDGATKLAYLESQQVAHYKDLYFTTEQEILNWKDISNNKDNQLKAANKRISQLKKRKFRWGPGAGIGISSRNGDLSASPSVGLFLVWGR